MVGWIRVVHSITQVQDLLFEGGERVYFVALVSLEVDDKLKTCVIGLGRDAVNEPLTDSLYAETVIHKDDYYDDSGEVDDDEASNVS